MIELKAFNCVESDLQEFCEPRLVYLKDDADKVIDELEESIRKQKYWRCLARAKNAERMATHFIMLFSETNVSKLKMPYLNKMKIYYKWQNLWLKLAEKFKEAK